jgi:hypothetical protein
LRRYVLDRLAGITVKHGWLTALTSGLTTAMTACGGLPPDELEVGRFHIVGGLIARSPELDHTGAIVRIERETGARSVLCTATLVGAETALTAKHCADRVGLVRTLGDEVSLAIGFDIATAELVPVVAMQVPPAASEGGALGAGFDLAVIHLDEPLAVPPAQARPFDPHWVRRSMVTLGYGMPNVWSQPDGFRRVGRETVVAVSGLVYEILYGDFESYLEVELTGASTNEDYLARAAVEPSSTDVASLHDVYAHTRLIPGHEIVTKTLDANTRSCRGDSGGPLLGVSEQGEWEVYGVLSGGPSSLRAECDFGQVWSTLGPVTFPFVEASRDWSDPCGSVHAAGACAGSVIERCESDWVANVRQLVREDCGASGLACRVERGVAQCVESGER